MKVNDIKTTSLLLQSSIYIPAQQYTMQQMKFNKIQLNATAKSL